MKHTWRRVHSSRSLNDLIVPSVVRGAFERLAERGRVGRIRGGAWVEAPRCLIHGPGGTGKTLAAEALAGELGEALFRVDLGVLVSNYGEETERELAGLIEEAEAAGAILLFDEADALFGKRTGVKDAHDRYADDPNGFSDDPNGEGPRSFVLSWIDQFAGMVLVAARDVEGLDGELLERCPLRVELSTPGPHLRFEFWNRSLPDRERWEAGLELHSLVERFELTGREIRAAAERAIELASNAEDRLLRWEHLEESLLGGRGSHPT